MGSFAKPLISIRSGLFDEKMGAGFADRAIPGAGQHQDQLLASA
jgi:hypothetical protein